MAANSKVTVKLFASLRELVGEGTLEWPVPETGILAGDLLKALVNEYPSIAGPARVARILVNRQYAGAETEVQPGDEVAIIPPVGGGA